MARDAGLRDTVTIERQKKIIANNQGEGFGARSSLVRICRRG
jgi:hypothetical protein